MFHTVYEVVETTVHLPGVEHVATRFRDPNVLCSLDCPRCRDISYLVPSVIHFVVSDLPASRVDVLLWCM